MSQDSLDHKSFIYSSVDDNESVDGENHLLVMPSTARSIRTPLRRKIEVVIFFASLVLNVVLFGMLWVRYSNSIEWRGVKPLYSPVQDSISYEYRLFTSLLGTTKYHGPPSDEVDAAWEDLYEIGVSSIPTSQAALLPNRSEAFFGNEDQYIISIDVFHQLHCLDTLRKYIYPERYPEIQKSRFQNTTGGPVLFDHVDHCINAIRESLTCSADVTANTWKWDEKKQWSYPHFDLVHTCRNFNAIHDWAVKAQAQMHFNNSIRVQGKLPYLAADSDP